MKKQYKKIGSLLLVGAIVLTSACSELEERIDGKVNTTKARTVSLVKKENGKRVTAEKETKMTETEEQNAGIVPLDSETENSTEVNLIWKNKKTTIKADKKFTFQVQLQEEGEISGSAVSFDETKVSWEVSNTKIASINKNGVFKGKRKGKVTVRASYEDKVLACKVTVKGKQIIGIDPGHQKYGDSSLEASGPGSSVKKAKVAGGTSGVATKVPEYQLNLDIAKALKKELINRGYDVVMTRTTNDINISNKERAQKINKSGADICIRLHADGGASSAKGASGLYPSSKNPYVSDLSKKSYRLSNKVLESYCKETGISNRGNIQRDDLTGTNWSEVPVIVLEMGFMTNATEDKYMQSEDGQEAMVEGIANGIDAYYK